MGVFKPPFQVHITGGEPFLNFDVLLHAVQSGSKKGFPCYVETNAGWCVNQEFAEKRLHTLHQAGLQAILISVSPFHAETIPLKYTLNGINAALRVFGPQRTIVYMPEWLQQISQFDVQKPISLNEYLKTYGHRKAGRMFWEGYSLISGGRCGYRLGDLTNRLSAIAYRGENCLHEILLSPHSHFDLFGNFIPGFCGGITLGDWHDLPGVRAAYRGGKYPTLIRILIDSGPYGLYDLALSAYEYQPLLNGYAGKCHLCVDVRKHLIKEADFRELAPPGFYTGIDLPPQPMMG
jgi:hypothetical protein